jgi:uncharacterized membrane protein YhaH (DUF805 family)
MTQRTRRIATKTYSAGFLVAWLLAIAAAVEGHPRHGVLHAASSVYLLAFMLPACILLTRRWFRDLDRERIDAPAFAVQLEEQRRAR